MRKFNIVERVALGLALTGMIVPTAGFAAEPVAPTQQTAQVVSVTDVQVAGGVLSGVLLNSAGQPVDGAVVALWQGQTKVSSTTTARDGSYKLPVRSGAHYVVAANGSETVVRTWDAAIAPPAAQTALTMVQRTGTLRSQDCCEDACAPACGGGGCGGGMGGGALLGLAGIATGAIVGGIALSKANDNEDDIDALQDQVDVGEQAIRDLESNLNLTRSQLEQVRSAIANTDFDDDDSIAALQQTLNDIGVIGPLPPVLSPSGN